MSRFLTLAEGERVLKRPFTSPKPGAPAVSEVGAQAGGWAAGRKGWGGWQGGRGGGLSPLSCLPSLTP
jgi:hypothetical protein